MTCRQLFISWLLLLTANSQAAWQQWHPIVQAASQAAYQHYQARYPSAEISAKIEAPDRRLKLANCDNNLTYDLGTPPERGGNLSIQVKCQGQQAWSMYLTAKVQIKTEILITRHALKRGSRIGKSDIDTRRVDLAETRGGTLYEPGEAIDMELRRSLPAASPLRLRDVIEPLVIKRGDRVQIAAHIGGLRVLMPGTALANGRLGEQIVISNDRSERRIRAKVVAEGKVEVTL